MNDEALYDSSRRPFIDNVAHICLKGALIYLDQGAGEVVHTSLGLQFLFGEDLEDHGMKMAKILPTAHPCVPPILSARSGGSQRLRPRVSLDGGRLAGLHWPAAEEESGRPSPAPGHLRDPGSH